MVANQVFHNAIETVGLLLERRQRPTTPKIVFDDESRACTTVQDSLWGEGNVEEDKNVPENVPQVITRREWPH